MNIKRIGIIGAYIGIVFIIVFLSTATYAVLTVSPDKNNQNNNYLTNNLTIKYKETSNVSIVNYVPSQSLTKTFSVTNNSDNTEYYDIRLEKVINNFEDKDNLIYTLTSENGGYVSETSLPSDDKYIVSNVKIEPKEKHNYILNINFIKTNKDQSKDLNKTFSSNIKITSSQDAINYAKNTLGEKIISEVVSSFNNIDIHNYKDGVYFTNSSIDGKSVYFYRGSNNLNNNAIFGSDCYKIIRTTEDGGIRLIYNGKSNEGKCSNKNNVLEDDIVFNTRSNYNAYVGYMYGDASSNNYENEHKNINSSLIKTYLDEFYLNNLIKYNDFIASDTVYCNNRVLAEFKIKGVTYSKYGYGNNNTGYEMMNNYLNNKVSYDCPNKNDRFSVNSENGNNMLSNSIGLITLEELFYAGYLNNKDNSSNYLYSLYPYWTMTSAYFSGSNAYNFIVDKGKINTKDVSHSAYVRPVITLKSTTTIIKGDGSLDNPYVLFRRVL